MCVDNTSLNKACPKDLFPLLCIDQVVDSTLGSDVLSFIDTYSRLSLDRDEEIRLAYHVLYHHV